MTRFGVIWILLVFVLSAGGCGSGAPARGAVDRPPASRLDGCTFDVRAFGATGDGVTFDTAAIQKAIDAAAAAGAGIVVVPPGAYLTAMIHLRSHVTVEIRRGATVLGSADPADYPLQPDLPLVPPGIELEFGRRTLILAREAHDVALVGEGTIRGQGSAESFNIEKNRARGLTLKQAQQLRPILMTFVQCRDVTVRDLTFRDSATWIQDYLDCDNVRVEGITVRSHAHLNNDGLDVDSSRNVRIANCDFDCGDDAISLKSTYNVCENVVIANCVLRSGSNAIKFGTASNPGFRNVAIRNIAIHDTAHSGLALEVVDGGAMENVTISGLTMTNVGNPLFIRVGDRRRHWRTDRPAPQGAGTLRGVVISDITATVGNHPPKAAFSMWGFGKYIPLNPIPSSITGLPGHPVQDVTLSNIRITCIGGGRREHAAIPLDKLSAVPEKEKAYPEFWMFGELPAYGLYCRHVDGLTVSGVEFRCRETDDRPALVCDDVKNLRLDGFQVGTGKDPSLVLHDVAGALIRGCVAPAGVPAFLRLQGRTERVSVIGNDLSRTQVPFQFDAVTPPTALFEASNRMARSGAAAPSPAPRPEEGGKVESR